MLFAVAGHPLLEEGPRVEETEGHERQEHRGPEDLRDGVAGHVDAPRREDPQRAFEPPDVPVGLCRGRHGGRLERAVEPDGIDLRDPAEAAEHGEHGREQADRARRVRRPEP